MSRDNLARSFGPMGSSARTGTMSRRVSRAPLAPGKIRLVMEPEERLKIHRLADGRYLVVTERIVTADELRELGIPAELAEVPWEKRPAADPGITQRRQATSSPVEPRKQHPINVAMDYWRKNLGGFDPRLPALVPGALHEFGLDRLLRAFDEVKGLRGRERYYGLKDLLNQWRREGTP
jgi:hypothetical protein